MMSHVTILGTAETLSSAVASKQFVQKKIFAKIIPAQMGELLFKTATYASAFVLKDILVKDANKLHVFQIPVLTTEFVQYRGRGIIVDVLVCFPE